jgi:hypothetical protein
MKSRKWFLKSCFNFWGYGMSVERELGELSTKVEALTNSQENTNKKLDTLMAANAILMNAHNNNLTLSTGAILAAFGAVLTAIFSFVKAGSAGP